MDARLELEGLSFRYPGAGGHAVVDLSLTVGAGELIALLGPSGCGKTTTLKLICGLLEPAAGEIRIDGTAMRGVPPERRAAAMVFQRGLLFEHLDVAGNVGFGLHMRRLPASMIAPRVQEALERVQLAGFGKRRVRELSGGEQQRVALARALVTEPRVLLLDEPLSALDPGLRGDMRELLLDVQRGSDRATVLVTHDQHEAVHLGDRIGLLIGGRLRMIDRPQAFYERPATREVAEFFGAGNFIDGDAADGRLRTCFGTLALAAPAGPGPCTVVIRPESLRLGDGENAFAARVAETRYLGTRIEYRFTLGAQRLLGSLPADVRLAAGETVMLRLPSAALWPLE